MRVVSGNQWTGDDDALRTPLWPVVRDHLAEHELTSRTTRPAGQALRSPLPGAGFGHDEALCRTISAAPLSRSRTMDSRRGVGRADELSLHSGLVGGSVDQDAMPREDFSMPPSNRTRPSSITRMRSYTSHRFASRRIEVGHQLTQEKQPARRRRDGHPDAGARGHGADLRLAVHTGLPPERFLDSVDEPAVVHGRGEAHQFAHREAATERLVLLQGRQPGCSGSPGTSAPAPSSYGVSCPHLRRGPEARTQDAFACSRPPPFAATTAR